VVHLEVSEHGIEPREQDRFQVLLDPLQPAVHMRTLLVGGAIQVEVSSGDAGKLA